MKHDLSLVEQVNGTLIALLPIVILVLSVVMLVDCYRKARTHRPLWLLVIFFTGILGYAFFYLSDSRAKS
jgi:TctA family transporter